jgi:formiminoglutamase
MARINPPDRVPLETAADDPRIGRLLGSRLAKGGSPEAVILGFPSDEGVRRNGGRVGAAEGPTAIRRVLYRMAPDPRFDPLEDLVSHTSDLGDLQTAGDVEQDQQNLGEALAPYLERGAFAIVLGGGHETSYGHFLGYVRAHRQVEILNWDAHADVRELSPGQAHSGSPFRQAMEDPSHACRRYSVAGLQAHSVARAHLKFVAGQGRTLWADQLSTETVDELYLGLTTPALVSFDLDAVHQSDAPGVSAPNPNGLRSELWLYAAYAAGRAPAVASADVVELNPRVDRDGQTARLAALTVWWLLRGRAERR